MQAADLMMNMAVVLTKEFGMSMDDAKTTLSSLLIEYGGGGPENLQLNGEPLDKNYDIDSLSPESLQKAQADCDAFSKEIAEWIRQIPQGVSLDQIGHDFWLTRNGHGVGFWDRPEMYGGKENADRISDIARAWGEIYIAVGDDGQLHMEGGR